MGQWLRALSALTEGHSSVPGTHTGELTFAVTPAPGDLTPSPVLHGHPHAPAHTNTHIYT